MRTIEYLFRFLYENSFSERMAQARAIFTTACIQENVEADTAECDAWLDDIYTNYVDMEISRTAFDNYMVALIV